MTGDPELRRDRQRAPAPAAGPASPSAPGASPGTPSAFELALLSGLLFVLPLFEVPKQLLWLGWVVVWFRARGPGAFRGEPWMPEERALLAFALSVMLAGAFGGHWLVSVSAGADALRIALSALLIARGGYAPAQLLTAFAAGLAGTLVAAIWGAWRLMTSAQPGFLELNSVGHVNHSAIHLGITLAIAVGLALAHRPLRSVRGAVAAASAVAIATALLVSASRAAIGASLGFLLLLAWSDPRPREGRGRPWLALLGAIALVAMLYGLFVTTSVRPLQPPGAGFSEKFESRFTPGGLLAFRDKLWRVAAIAFASEPVFGIGNDRFRALTPESLCPAEMPDRAVPGHPALPASSARANRDGPDPGGPRNRGVGWTGIDPCDAERLYFKEHAHSLYANVLAERGTVGVVAVVALLGIWARALLRSRGLVRQSPAMAGLWCIALGAWCLSALAGLLNTTLHHEHGLLAMIAFGALVAMRRQTPWRDRADAAIAPAGNP